MRPIPFTIRQTVQTVFPQNEVTLIFYGLANVHFDQDGNHEIEITSITGPKGSEFGTLEIPDFTGQKTAYGEMGRFLSLCKTEAHRVALEMGYFDAPRPNLHKPVMLQEMSEI